MKILCFASSYSVLIVRYTGIGYRHVTRRALVDGGMPSKAQNNKLATGGSVDPHEQAPRDSAEGLSVH